MQPCYIDWDPFLCDMQLLFASTFTYIAFGIECSSVSLAGRLKKWKNTHTYIHTHTLSRYNYTKITAYRFSFIGRCPNYERIQNTTRRSLVHHGVHQRNLHLQSTSTLHHCRLTKSRPFQCCPALEERSHWDIAMGRLSDLATTTHPKVLNVALAEKPASTNRGRLTISQPQTAR